MKTPWSVDAPRAPLYLVLIWTLHPALGWCGALTVTLMLALALALVGLNERLNRRALILAAAGGAAVNGWRLDGAHQRALTAKQGEYDALASTVREQNRAVEKMGEATIAADGRRKVAEALAKPAIDLPPTRGRRCRQQSHRLRWRDARSVGGLEMKLILIALLLTGCATTKPPTVSIPVAVGCVGELPARPVNTFGTGAYPGDKAAAQAALVDSAAWEGYATKLEVVIAGCPAK